MIKHLKGLEINTIYDFDNAFSINELLCKFWEKIEESINISNESIDILNWIKEQGLPNEVQLFINQLVTDGTIEQMINIDKIDKVKNTLTNDIQTFKEETTNKFTIVSSQLDTIANKGTTVEVLERVTKEEINRQIEDGTIANLTIEDNSITWDKFKNELKSNINQLVKNTTINNDGSVKEIFTDNKYKITTFENNVVNEKWYTSDNNLLFTKSTTLNYDGSISEALI